MVIIGKIIFGMGYLMNNMIAILQARSTSSRLPGKVLKNILGKPMLLHQIERILQAKKIDKLVVATSSDSSDDNIFNMCQSHNITCYRGDLQDVLDRFYNAAKYYSAKYVIRLTGDCPLTDPKLLDEIIKFFLDGNFDYASNTIERTFPDGLDIEIFTFKCLTEAWLNGKGQYQREHVTPYIYQNSQIYKLGSFKNSQNLSNLRWTVDEPEDFILIEQIYKDLYNINPGFDMYDVLKLIKQKPDLLKINANLH